MCHKLNLKFISIERTVIILVSQILVGVCVLFLLVLSHGASLLRMACLVHFGYELFTALGQLFAQESSSLRAIV